MSRWPAPPSRCSSPQSAWASKEFTMNTISTDNDIYSGLGLTTQASVNNSNVLGMDDFLNLMITELNHQDPTKPMDNSQLATQISQFSTVSGIQDLNSAFTGLSADLTSGQALQAANLVGHEVLVATNSGWLSNGGSVRGVTELPSSAADLTVRVTDASGALVREIELGSQSAGQIKFSWDGYDDRGNYMPEGVYEITAHATVDDAELSPYVYLNAKVDSVNLGGADGLGLNIQGLGQISMNNVAQIF
ncbi:hypothetical protein DJ030_09890 [bacterium endosymbiont of Escarpia laminata]|nr:MAG: hypothetical protein DJ030_09890 [bacterium endosymbiont of Escarpia laminata]